MQMQFTYGKAPLTFTDGIPTFKAGEWPGIKPCKFHSYKRVIRPIDCGIIFNEKEPPLPPRRRLLGRTGPSPEYIFRSSSKFVPVPGSENKQKNFGLRYIEFPSKPSVPRPERRHFFEYKNQKENLERERERAMTSGMKVREEFRLMGLIGFGKKEYEGVSNERLRMRGGIRGLKVNEEPDFLSMTRTQRAAYRRNKTQENNKNLMDDVNYVENLNGWERRFAAGGRKDGKSEVKEEEKVEKLEGNEGESGEKSGNKSKKNSKV